MARVNPALAAGKLFGKSNPGLSWEQTIDQCPHPMCGVNETPDGQRRDWLGGAMTARAKRKADA
jgi:hypothetical protein